MSTIAPNDISTFHQSWPVVIALHCSGGSPCQWRHLTDALGPRFEVVAPDLYGSDPDTTWGGEHAFSLGDEARRIVGIIDACDAPVHLVGHSYGGGVALRVAVERPTRIASAAVRRSITMNEVSGELALEVQYCLYRAQWHRLLDSPRSRCHPHKPAKRRKLR